MTRTKSTVLALLAVLLSPIAANADPIINATGLASPDQIITFDGLANGTNVTNEFAGQGVVFDGVFRVQLGCVGGIIGPCVNSDGVPSNIYSIQFLQSVSEVALALVTNTGTTTFSAFLGGSLVESFVASTNNNGVIDYFGFSNIVFDELQYTISAFNSNQNMDNVQYVAASVPEPGTLALFGIGLLGMGAARRRKKA